MKNHVNASLPYTVAYGKPSGHHNQGQGSRGNPRFATYFAAFLGGEGQLGLITSPPETVFREGSGRIISSVPPNDRSYYEVLNKIVQQEPAGSLDSELVGSLASIGIVKGPPCWYYLSFAQMSGRMLSASICQNGGDEPYL